MMKLKVQYNVNFVIENLMKMLQIDMYLFAKKYKKKNNTNLKIEETEFNFIFIFNYFLKNL